MIVSDNSLQVEDLGDFFKNLCKNSVKVGRNLAKNVFKNPRGALEVGANVGCAFASRSPKTALSSSPEIITFYHTGNGLCFGKNV